MISSFDHVVIAVRDLAAGIAAYETLLARQGQRQDDRDGVSIATIRMANVAVELVAPAGDGEAARRLRAALDDEGEGLKSLAFAVDRLEQAHRRLERVGLAPHAMDVHAGWRSSCADAARTHGVGLVFAQADATPAPPPADVSAVAGIDHIVIRTPDPERAAALYGARLGLDMRLDREVAGRRLMFFRCGDAIVEIAHAVDIADGRDRLWGLSWRVGDADAARTRLAAAGLDVSEVRAGMKRGTRVFSVREQTCGVPTLMIELSPRRD